MIKLFKFSGILLFSLLLIVSCNSELDKTTTNPKAINKQKFNKIIPTYSSGKQYYPYTLTQELTKKSSLCVIENGYDSIFFRIWYIYNNIPTQVVDLKKESRTWTGEYHIIEENFDTVNYVSKFTNAKTSKISPKSGWTTFVNKVLSLGITTLPPDFEVPGYDGLPTHAEFVIVEISTATNYKIYSYSMPMLFPEIKEPKAMEDIMELIENEFGVKRLVKF